MKQQELLRKQADMMDMAEKLGVSWQSLVNVKYLADFEWCNIPRVSFLGDYDYQSYRFAIAVVEGKPVFDGDELYAVSDNVLQIANDRHLIAKQKVYDSEILMQDGGIFHTNRLTWNPPKPKTVMVELSVADVVSLAKGKAETKYTQAYKHMVDACRKVSDEL